MSKRWIPKKQRLKANKSTRTSSFMLGRTSANLTITSSVSWTNAWQVQLFTETAFKLAAIFDISMMINHSFPLVTASVISFNCYGWWWSTVPNPAGDKFHIFFFQILTLTSSPETRKRTLGTRLVNTRGLLVCRRQNWDKRELKI